MNPHPDSREAVLNEQVMHALDLHTQPFCEQASGRKYFTDTVMQMQLNMLQVLKGDTGSGKTALVIQMLSKANDEFQIFIVRGKASLTAPEILTGMLKIFQQPAPNDLGSCLSLLIKHLKIRLEKNLSSVLIVENAHAISVDSLNQLLAYTDTINQALDGELRILLVADPVIGSILPKLNSKQLREGKVFISSVRVLDRQRTREYIEYRLQQAGFQGAFPFSDKQLNKLYESTDGIPQKLDTVATDMLNQQMAHKPAWIPLQILSLRSLPLPLIAGAVISIISITLLLFVLTDAPDEDKQKIAEPNNPEPVNIVQALPLITPQIFPPAKIPTNPIDDVATTRSATSTNEAFVPGNKAFVKSYPVKGFTPNPAQKPVLVQKQKPSAPPKNNTPASNKQTAKPKPDLSQSERWLVAQKPTNYTIPSHQLVRTAIKSLARLTHRGAVAADGKSGDGCGLLLRKPKTFLQKVAQQCHFDLAEQFAVGNIFLSRDQDKAQYARNELNTQIKARGLHVVGWRKVPVNPQACGRDALASLPLIEQVFVNAPATMKRAEFNRHLFLARRKTELSLAENTQDDEFYVCTLACEVILCKGLVMPVQLPVFFQDLNDPDMASSIAVFHQHTATVEARTTLSLPRPQRRNQHHSRQSQLGARTRAPLPLRSAARAKHLTPYRLDAGL